jgi:hypothetical protein
VSDELDVVVARWLTSPDGLAAVAEATAALDVAAHDAADGSDPHATRDATLRLATGLRRRWPEPGRAAAVLAAALARRRARASWPHAEELLFTRSGLEQASAPRVSAWRAARYADADGDVWDLCAGIGGDALALATAIGADVRGVPEAGPVAPGTRSVVAVDVDAARLVLLEHNARVLARAVSTRVADAVEVPLPPGRWLHADPARRHDDGRRVRALADHHPPVAALVQAHRAAAALGIVLSPAVSLDDRDLPLEAEIEFVAVGGRLVEAVAWLGGLAVPGRAATATVLDERHPAGSVSIARARGPRVELPVAPVGDYLVEVAAVAVRARLHDAIGAELGAWRLARTRALLSLDTPPPASPWYRARRVVAVLPARARSVRAWLRERDPPAIEVAVHGLDADPEAWWRQLGRPARGPAGWRLELVRLDVGAAAIVTEDPAARGAR